LTGSYGAGFLREVTDFKGLLVAVLQQFIQHLNIDTNG